VIYLIIGRRELGKTTLARYLAHKQSPRVILDPRAQWQVTDPYPAIDRLAMLDDLQAGADVVIQPEELQPAVDDAADVVKTYLTKSRSTRLSVVCDEAGLYHLRAWSWLIRCSPRDRINILITAHRPADISTDIRSLADTWCIFRTTQPHDLNAIEERCGPDVVAAVQKLDRYQFVTWDDAKAEIRIIKNSDAWKMPADGPIESEPIEPAPSKSPRLW
jgi:hypothetical protein